MVDAAAINSDTSREHVRTRSWLRNHMSIPTPLDLSVATSLLDDLLGHCRCKAALYRLDEKCVLH